MTKTFQRLFLPVKMANLFLFLVETLGTLNRDPYLSSILLLFVVNKDLL